MSAQDNAAALRVEPLRIGDQSFTPHASGALFHEGERLLVVSDLHLEKGSAYAARRVLLPPYDTAATLARLEAVVARLRPRAVLALGDSFHDTDAGARMDPRDAEALRALQRGREWIWAAGNHDPQAPAAFGGARCAQMRVGEVILRHEALGEGFEIAGHLHPVARVASPRGAVRRRCFVNDGARCVMPAFGAYAGGLNVLDAAFAPLLARERASAHVLGRDAVYRVSLSACRPD